MINQKFSDIYTEELATGAIINDRHTMHREDYLIIHCLLRIYKPKTFFEVGTHTGFGTKIICNALEKNYSPVEPGYKVYSLDLPAALRHFSAQHPEYEGRKVGMECDFPYTQLWGDSTNFSYEKYPCEGYFIDAEHTFENVLAETQKISALGPKIIIWHDTDEPEVFNAAIDGMDVKPYQLYRVADTRILYAIRNSKE
jgi:hypothetical protein